MKNQLYVAQGDITRLLADAIAYSTSIHLPDFEGALYGAFCSRFREFDTGYQAGKKNLAAGRSQLEYGEGFWLKLKGKGRLQGIAVVAAGGGADSSTRPAEWAVRKAIRIAAKAAQAPPGQQRLIALPAFRIGMGGDELHDLQSLRAQVQAASEEIQHHPNLHIVIVGFSQRVHQLLLTALAEVRLPVQSETAPAPLVRALQDRECAVFVGAGLSVGAGMPSYGDLMKKIASRLELSPGDYNSQDDYLDLAQWFRDTYPGQTGPLIESTFGRDEATVPVSLSHCLLMNLPLRYVVTTNYDPLLEASLRMLRRHPVVVIEPQEVAETGKLDGTFVIKMHGDAAHNPDSVVLSRDDYENFFRHHPAMASLLEGLLLNHTFLFVGYSLRDPNFRQILHKIGSILQDSKRPAFAVTFDAINEHQHQYWSKRGLQLIALPRLPLDERPAALAAWLQNLSLSVFGQVHHFLHRDVAPPPELAEFQEALLSVGKTLEHAVRTIPISDLQVLEKTLSFLTSLGWKPANESLHLLWQKLAGDAGDPCTRRRCLVAALEHARTLEEATEIKRLLATIIPGVEVSTR